MQRKIRISPSTKLKVSGRTAIHDAYASRTAIDRGGESPRQIIGENSFLVFIIINCETVGK